MRLWPKRAQGDARRKKMETFAEIKARLGRNPWFKVKVRAPWPFGLRTVKGSDYEIKDANIYEVARRAQSDYLKAFAPFPLAVMRAVRDHVVVVIE
jgi:hypothetical protein